MRRSTILLFFVIQFNFSGRASVQPRADSLTLILRAKLEDFDRQRQLTKLIFNRFLLSSAYDQQQSNLSDSLTKYDTAGSKALELLPCIFILRRNFNFGAAEKKLVDAIGVAQSQKEMYLLYYFYINLAYVQADQNNAVAAIHNYRQARKTANELSDFELVISTEIGISDIFTTIGLYQQALLFLNSSQKLLELPKNSRSPSRATIYLNKAEIFFRTGELDSLAHYQKLYRKYGAKSYDRVRNLKRLDYYRLILSHQHRKAIVLIRELLITGNLYYKNVDRWFLAQSLYAVKNPDSAAIEAGQILRDDKNGPSPIRLNAYKLIGNVAEDKNQHILAERYFKLALAESEGFTVKMRSVDQLSTELRQDRLDAAFQAQYLLYNRERIVLFASIAVATLIILIIYLFYRNVKQKNSYQKLLHETRSQELAFINSHQVRKPLANILGICRLLIDNKNTVEENNIYYKLLDQQVKEMDQKLREVEIKLREHN